VLPHRAPRFQCFALNFLPGLLRLSFEVLPCLTGFLFDLLAGFLELLPGLTGLFPGSRGILAAASREQ
jgi:hypothetical protein